MNLMQQIRTWHVASAAVWKREIRRPDVELHTKPRCCLLPAACGRCSANGVARFRSAVCEKNDRLPKSPTNPIDPQQPFGFFARMTGVQRFQPFGPSYRACGHQLIAVIDWVRSTLRVSSIDDSRPHPEAINYLDLRSTIQPPPFF